MILAASLVAPAAAEESDPPCRQTERSRALDFWLGRWRVELPNGAHAGDNEITMILEGCAIEEDWRSTQGGRGRSLFTYDARSDEWAQVWVTADTSTPWGLKRKTLIDSSDGRVVFQGAAVGPQGPYLDRTTLTQQPDGSVRQVIEISADGGASWRATFDAIYRPLQ